MKFRKSLWGILFLVVAYVGFHIVCLDAAISANDMLNKLPYPFLFDGPYYPEPSLTFKGTFPKVPKRLMVYKIIDPNVSEEVVRNIAKKHGFLAGGKMKRTPARQQYWLKESHRELSVTPANGRVEIKSYPKKTGKHEDENFPSADQCVKIAEKHCKVKGFLPKGAYLRKTVDRTKTSERHVTVLFGRRINGYKVWGSGSYVAVDIGPSGKIKRLRKQWREFVGYRLYPLKTPREALAEIMNGKGKLMHGSHGEIKHISLVYYVSYHEKQKFVQPCYFFECATKKGESFFGVLPAIKSKSLEPRE